MGLSEAASLAIESWTLYAIAILTVAARLYVLQLQSTIVLRSCHGFNKTLQGISDNITGLGQEMANR